MQDVEIHGLNALCKSMEWILKETPKLQRDAHEFLGQKLLDVVQHNIQTHLNERNGKISDWQSSHVGTRGGYAAVRADSSPSGPNGAGAVTNYLENGHVVRTNMLHSKRQRRSLRQLRNQSSGNWVRGRQFYAASRNDAPRLLLAAANELADKIADKLR